MKFYQIIFSLALFTLGLSLATHAQSKDGLKKVEKSEQPTQSKKVITPRANSNVESREVKYGQADDSFKKKKTAIDKAKSKIEMLRSKFNLKKESGSWTKEKYKKMMAKLDKREMKVEAKKQKLIQSLSKK